VRGGAVNCQNRVHYNRRMLSRCALLLVGGLLLTCVPVSAQNASRHSEAEIHVFLDQFIAAFDNLDWEKFRTCFADDATVIHPALFSHRLDGRAGYEPAWQKVFEKTRTDSGKSQPPYMDLQPKDLKIQMLNQAAVVTFHLDRGHSSTGRRTLVLRKGADGWKIVHLHASNVDF